MALVNEHFLKLSNNYLFADIAKKVNAYKVSHPKTEVISLGIGDVTQPLCPAVIDAMHKAVDEMAEKATFRGYGPERGYDFLREAILKNDFQPRGIHLDPSEIFVNDGAKSDTGNIQEIVRWDNSIGVTDPIYPVYIDSNVMIGRAGIMQDGKWSNVTYFPCTAENGFVPENVFLERLHDIAVNALGDACTGSNPRQPSVEEMEKLLKCCYYDTEVDF